MLWKMKWLRHLYLPSSFRSRSSNHKLRFDKLSNLQILENFSNAHCYAKDLYKLTNLQALSAFVYISPSVHSDAENSAEIIDYILKSKTLRRISVSLSSDSSVDKEKFDSLVEQCLSSCKISDLFVQGPISNLPKFSEANFVGSILVDLEFNETEMEEDPMVILEKLPNLRRLTMWPTRYVGKEAHCHPSGFPKLRFLCLCLDIEEWRIDEGAMPKLSTLDIQCPTLEMIPDGLRFITTLQALYISVTSKELADRLQEGVDGEEEGMDYQKIRRIPAVVARTRY